MSTPRKPNQYLTPKVIARRYLDGEYEGFSVTEVAALERVHDTSLRSAIKREQEKRVMEEVC